MNWYEIFVDKMSQVYTDLNYCIVALNEEAGEIAGWYKKCVLRGNPTGKLNDQDLKEELGDLLFYLVRTAALKGWTMNDIMATNVKKLEARVAAGKKSIA